MTNTFTLYSYNLEDLGEMIEKSISKIIKYPTKTNESIQERRILTRKETADLLSISLPTLHSYTQRGIIKAFRLGTKVRYRTEDIYQSLQKINVGGKIC